MKKILVILFFICLIICIPVTANPVPFSSWISYGDALKSTNDTFTLLKYSNLGSFNYSPQTGISSAYILVIGGGGGGGADWGGGGGAGGLVYNASYPINPSNYYRIHIGDMGVGGSSTNDGTDGGKSWFENMVANGGGHGSGSINNIGGDGGSGGGGNGKNGNYSGGLTTQLSNTNGSIGYGHSGAISNKTSYGGGGGGAESSAITSNGGNGINFTSVFSIIGDNGCVGGGGGGFNIGSATCGGGNTFSHALNETGGGGGDRANGGTGAVYILYRTPSPISGIINITVESAATTYINWHWNNNDSYILYIDGYKVYNFDANSSNFILSDLNPNEQHSIKVYNSTGYGYLLSNTTTGANALFNVNTNITNTNANSPNTEKIIGIIAEYIWFILGVFCLFLSVRKVPLAPYFAFIFGIIGLITAAVVPDGLYYALLNIILIIASVLALHDDLT